MHVIQQTANICEHATLILTLSTYCMLQGDIVWQLITNNQLNWPSDTADLSISCLFFKPITRFCNRLLVNTDARLTTLL